MAEEEGPVMGKEEKIWDFCVMVDDAVEEKTTGEEDQHGKLEGPVEGAKGNSTKRTLLYLPNPTW